MNKSINNRTFIIIVIISFLTFALYDITKFSVFDGGVDSGYYLSTARDWVKLGRIPNFDTYSIYTPIGVMLYAIPYLMFDSPDITLFLSLNLFIYSFSFMLFLRLAVHLFGKSKLTLVLVLTFLYNTHEIVNDVKLENLVLVLGLLIVNYFSKLITITNADNKNWGFKEAFIIGSLCGFSFLTKQFGGLSLILSIITVFLLFKKTGFRLGATIVSSFSLVISIYIFLQILAGLSVDIIFGQLKGEFLLHCEGSVYGRKNIKDLFVGIKYFKFDGILFLGIFALIILVNNIVKKREHLQLKNIQVYSEPFLFIVVFVLSLLPFYFQIYPHYKLFGTPFVYFVSMLLLEKVTSVANVSILGLVVKLIGIFTLCMSIYSSVKWFRYYESLKLNKNLSLDFEKSINTKLKKGSLVHCLHNRKLWYKCEFISPFPKTIGYGFLHMNCLEQALRFEKPNSFWVIGGVDLQREKLPNYTITESHEFVNDLDKFHAVHFERDIRK